MTMLPHLYRRIRADSDHPNFDALIKRENAQRPYKAVLILICYPMYYLCTYSLTGDIDALAIGYVCFVLWLVMLYCTVELFKISDEYENDISEPPPKKEVQFYNL